MNIHFYSTFQQAFQTLNCREIIQLYALNKFEPKFVNVAIMFMFPNVFHCCSYKVILNTEGWIPPTQTMDRIVLVVVFNLWWWPNAEIPYSNRYENTVVNTQKQQKLTKYTVGNSEEKNLWNVKEIG